jgi:hypothetical protein
MSNNSVQNAPATYAHKGYISRWKITAINGNCKAHLAIYISTSPTKIKIADW